MKCDLIWPFMASVPQLQLQLPLSAFILLFTMLYIKIFTCQIVINMFYPLFLGKEIDECMLHLYLNVIINLFRLSVVEINTSLSRMPLE